VLLLPTLRFFSSETLLQRLPSDPCPCCCAVSYFITFFQREEGRIQQT
jgi:hypothetical protein